jgi:hypothetical protein
LPTRDDDDDDDDNNNNNNMMIRIKLDKKRCSEHAPTVVGESHESEVTVLWN